MSQKSIESRGLSLHGKRLYFIGAGGVSMAALCLLARRDGAAVEGSDREENDGVRALVRAGIPIHIGHRAENIHAGLDAVIYSLAIGEDNPELRAARALGLTCLARPVYLGQYMRRYPERIGVSGTHGKSTVTAMLHRILAEDGRDPTVLCGIPPQGEAFSYGAGACLVYEGCEYRDALLSFCPTDLVLLNAEWDHPDYFASEASLLSTFRRAAEGAERRVILCADDARLTAAMRGLCVPTVTFGKGTTADVRYRILGHTAGCFAFSVTCGEGEHTVQLGVPGEFQVHNAMAALTEALALGVELPVIGRALGGYMGIARRMQRILYKTEVSVYYDYAHHPTEIRAAIRALRLMDARPLTVVFRPHTYTRTAALWGDFVTALREADAVLLTDIYAARETPIKGITAERLAAAIGDRARYVPIAELSREAPTLGGCVVLMGAGEMAGTVEKMINDE